MALLKNILWYFWEIYFELKKYTYWYWRNNPINNICCGACVCLYVIDQIDPDSSKPLPTLQSTTNGLLRPSEIPPSSYFWPNFFPSSIDFAKTLCSLEISKSWVLHLSCETLLGPSYDQAPRVQMISCARVLMGFNKYNTRVMQIQITHKLKINANTAGPQISRNTDRDLSLLVMYLYLNLVDYI